MRDSCATELRKRANRLSHGGPYYSMIIGKRNTQFYNTLTMKCSCFTNDLETNLYIICTYTLFSTFYTDIHKTFTSQYVCRGFPETICALFRCINDRHISYPSITHWASLFVTINTRNYLLNNEICDSLVSRSIIMSETQNQRSIHTLMCRL